MTGLNYGQIQNIKHNTRVMYTALSAPCIDCNITWHPLVMTFDHRDRAKKKYVIANIRAINPKKFLEEINKCDVVCRNCHDIREYLRDINVLEIGEFKQERYKYYERLVEYLCGGALLRKDAFDIVPLGDI